jgi:hypothetical protein
MLQLLENIFAEKMAIWTQIEVIYAELDFQEKRQFFFLTDPAEAHQGDQIGRMFASWAILFVGQFL